MELKYWCNSRSFVCYGINRADGNNQNWYFPVVLQITLPLSPLQLPVPDLTLFLSVTVLSSRNLSRISETNVNRVDCTINCFIKNHTAYCEIQSQSGLESISRFRIPASAVNLCSLEEEHNSVALPASHAGDTPNY